MQIILENLTDNAEILIEKSARNCYNSYYRFKPPKSTEKLIKKIIRKGHHAVLEMATATFLFKGVSRILTHELVRHRLASYAQESQRYVNYADTPGRTKNKDFNYVLPNDIENIKITERTNVPATHIPSMPNNNAFIEEDYTYKKIVDLCYKFYQEALENGIPVEDARYILPGATTADIYISANLREWRHIFKVRGAKRAHWEIRMAVCECFKFLKERCPNVFYDMELVNPNNIIDKKSHIIIK